MNEPSNGSMYITWGRLIVVILSIVVPGFTLNMTAWLNLSDKLSEVVEVVNAKTNATRIEITESRAREIAALRLEMDRLERRLDERIKRLEGPKSLNH